jgi:hypothetical protein
MKKLITLVILVAFTVATGSLLAQSHYTGGARPANYSQEVITPKVPVTNIPSGTITLSNTKPADFKAPEYGTYSPNRQIDICTSCATPEGEADIQDNGTDVTNGGCNSNPYVIIPIELGDTYCGRGNGYLTGGGDARDTDWYEFTLTENTTVYWSGIANFNFVLYIVALPCESPTVLASATPALETVGTASVNLDPGTYIAFVAPSFFGTDPSLDGDYMVTLTTEAPGDPATWCAYQFSCLACTTPEGEAPNVDNIGDMFNYGCNGIEFEPDRPPIYSPINIGDVICGSGDHYTIGDLLYRDTDWYRLVLATETTLYWSGTADFNITMFIIQGPCSTQNILATQTLMANTPGTISALLEPGEYFFWIGPSDFDSNNNGNYMVTLTQYNPGSPDNWCTPQLVPVSNWALFIGIGLILLFAVIRFRRFV